MQYNQCYWRDNDNNLWVSQSFVDENGVTYTIQTMMQKELEINDSLNKTIELAKENINEKTTA